MEKVAIFLDVANIEAAFRHYGVQPDYLGLREFFSEGRVCLDTFMYVPVSPYHPGHRQRLIRYLRQQGFLVRKKVGRKRPNNKWKCNMDTEMTIDMIRLADAGKADIFVSGSGDRDMMPLYEEIRQLGIRVEVASTPNVVADGILEAASAFIDLGEIIREQRDQGRAANENGRANLSELPGIN